MATKRRATSTTKRATAKAAKGFTAEELGFTDKAKLDDGAMWPTAFALTELTAADEEKIAALVKRAVR